MLIPTRNRLPYLQEALRSVLAQSHSDFEVVVSDDGSTDGSREFLENLSQRDRRVTLLTGNPEPGVFQNIAYLRGHVSSETWCVLGDDDRLLPEHLARLTDALIHDPVAVVAFGHHRVINGSGIIQTARSSRLLTDFGYRGLQPGRLPNPVDAALRRSLWLGSCLYRTEPLAREDFDLSVGQAADWDFAIRCASIGALQYVDRPLWEYRDHGASASRRARIDARLSAIRVLQKHEFPDTPNEQTRRRLLRQFAVSLAFAASGEAPPVSRDATALYRSAGGDRRNPRILALHALDLLPLAVRRRIVDLWVGWRDTPA